MSVSSAVLIKIISPVFSDLYNGAKGIVREELNRWKTDAGIKKACATLSKLEKVKTIWSPEEETPLKKFYYPSKLQTKVLPGETPITIKTESIDQLPQGNIVIEGIVGQGKSIFMRHLASTLLNIDTSAVATIPIFIELRTINIRRTLLISIYTYIETLGIKPTPETFAYLADSGKLTLLLDGFDEIPADCVNDVLFEINAVHSRHPNTKIIVSSRPRNHIQNASSFKVLELVKLDEDDYDQFVSKLITSKVKRFDVIEALTTSSDHIKGIISTPLMLTLVVLVYQTEKEIPSTLPEFFDKLFSVVFSKHDRLKAGFNRQHYSGLSERKLKQLFDTFCFMVIQGGGLRSLDDAMFTCAFDKATNYASECMCDIDNFRNDIIKVACLMIEEGIDTITFLHKSILDYHAASFIKNLPDNIAADFYRSAFENYRLWNNVVDFLKSIDTARYYNYYVKKLLKKPTEELGLALRSTENNSIISYLESIFPELTFDFMHYSLQSIGPFNRNEIEFFDRIGDAIMSTLPEDFDNEIDKTTLNKLVRSSIKQSPNMKGQSVTLRQYLLFIELDYLRSELFNIESEFFNLCDEAQRYHSLEKKKIGLFKELLVQAPRADDVDPLAWGVE